MSETVRKSLLEQAKKLYDEGQLIDSALTYRRFLQDEPENTDALYGWACIAYERGNAENAERLLKRLLALQPENAEALTKLGNIYAWHQQPARARQCFEKALSYDDKHLPAYDSLAHLFVEIIDDAWEGEVVARRGIAIDETYGLLQQMLAKALYMQGRTDEAASIYEEEIKRHPELEAGNMCNLGAIYEGLGDTKKAETCFSHSIELNPDDAEFHRRYSKVHKYKPADAHITVLEKMLTVENEDPLDNARINFALAKAYEDIREYDRSFFYLSAANNFARSSYKYDPEMTEKECLAIEKMFKGPFQKKGLPPRKSDITPIFILGMPRSGSTLIEQILFSHPEVTAAGEAPYLAQLQGQFGILHSKTYQEDVKNVPAKVLREIRNEYLSKLIRHAGKALYITDKVPANFFYIGLIRILFPQAKIIHCKRSPMDSCFSIYKNMFVSPVSYAYDLEELGRYYKGYEKIMAFWHKKLPGFIHDVSYENLVKDQERVTRDILTFCGLPWDSACLEFHKTERPVFTASSAQVKKPLYKGAIGTWRKYERHLGLLRDVLSKEM